jgi:hypothetical protein
MVAFATDDNGKETVAELIYAKAKEGQPALTERMEMESDGNPMIAEFTYGKTGDWPTTTRTTVTAAGNVIEMNFTEWKLEGKYAKPTWATAGAGGASAGASGDALALIRAIDANYWCIHADEKIKSASCTVTLPKQGKWTPEVTLTYTRGGGRSVLLNNPEDGVVVDEGVDPRIADDVALLEAVAYGYSLEHRFRGCTAEVAEGKVKDTTVITFTPSDAESAGFTKAMITVKGNLVTAEEIVDGETTASVTLKTKSVGGKLQVELVTAKSGRTTTKASLKIKAGKTYSEVSELKRDKDTFKFSKWKVELDK